MPTLAPYEYQVEVLEATVSKKDFKDGSVRRKVADHVQTKLTELGKDGFEFYREFPVAVRVQTGWFGRKSDGDYETHLIAVVFRRPSQ
jgi:hypothetical protein